ncbi:MAG TPA: hypothetical protein VG838_05885 [Opitutaceae bacterium]|nr:hypothetical protein [Opitutaceae bacterium]
MLAFVHLLLVGLLGWQLQSRVALLETFRGLTRSLAAFGLALFLATWTDFLLYVIAGWGTAYQWLAWILPAAAVLALAATRKPAANDGPVSVGQGAWRDGWFLFFAGFVLVRFVIGLWTDAGGTVWSNFNFTDTAFHLSVTNALLEAPRFPPMDLDLAPFPLKYHFLSDFWLAHLVRLGLAPLRAIWLMNLLGAAVLVGTMWAVLERWLRLPSRWIALGGLIFLFLNPALLNLIHFLAFNPPFFRPEDIFDGIVRFPYFNFEDTLFNLFEPQRGLLFSFPLALLVLHAAFGADENGGEDGSLRRSRRSTLEAFAIICLLPFSHIVAFAVLVPCLLPRLWRHRGWFFARYAVWVPVFAIGLLQLGYLLAYGPPVNPHYSGWDVGPQLPLQEFARFPALLRRPLFWFFVNGDFLFWGLLFPALALLRAASSLALREFLRRWCWYFAVVGGFFLLLNFYRYSFAWGDSNKFILFLNFGLSLVITLGAAQWLGRRQRVASQILWVVLFVLSVGQPAWGLARGLLAPPYGTIILFPPSAVSAAAWLKSSTPPGTLVLTAAYNDVHFVTALAGRPVPAGIYGDSNPYRQDERAELIRRVYEDGDLTALPPLKVAYLCLAANERRRYRLSPQWTARMQSGEGVAFHAGGGPEDFESVYIFDVGRLLATR